MPNEINVEKFLSLFCVVFSTANHEWSHAEIDKNQSVELGSFEISDSMEKAASNPIMRSILGSSIKLIFLKICETIREKLIAVIITTKAIICRLLSAKKIEKKQINPNIVML